MTSTASRTAAHPDAAVGANASLVAALSAALVASDVQHCLRRGTHDIEGVATGERVVDLLVDRTVAHRFPSVLASLGFKEARPRRSQLAPGVRSYFGLEPALGRLVHVRSQDRLLLGYGGESQVHWPIEPEYLSSARRSGLFPVPAPELQLAVTVAGLAVSGRRSPFRSGPSADVAPDLDEVRHLLAGDVDVSRVLALVQQGLRTVDQQQWERYLHALSTWPAARPVSPRWRLWASIALAQPWRRVAPRAAVHRPIRASTWQLTSGGAIVAVLGGDGAGKTTAVNGLASWLGGPFVTHTMHMGKPPRTVSSVAVKGAIFLARRASPGMRWLPNYPSEAEHRGMFPGYPWLLWQLATARDRRRHYRRARRLARQGDIVVCDRFPHPRIALMDGSRTGWVPARERGRLARLLVRMEQRCYADMVTPDVTAVLRVHPEIAVARKLGVDPAEFVHARSREVFNADWQDSSAVLVDASRSPAEVLEQLKGVVWERL